MGSEGEGWCVCVGGGGSGEVAILFREEVGHNIIILAHQVRPWTVKRGGEMVVSGRVGREEAITHGEMGHNIFPAHQART